MAAGGRLSSTRQFGERGRAPALAKHQVFDAHLRACTLPCHAKLLSPSAVPTAPNRSLCCRRSQQRQATTGSCCIHFRPGSAQPPALHLPWARGSSAPLFLLLFLLMPILLASQQCARLSCALTFAAQTIALTAPFQLVAVPPWVRIHARTPRGAGLPSCPAISRDHVTPALGTWSWSWSWCDARPESKVEEGVGSGT